MTSKIGFGGGCHWCTEAVFQTVKGVEKVEQGWIKSLAPHDGWSEAVIVYFDDLIIPLKVLLEIHLLTHSSRSMHTMRNKYRSAIYTFSSSQNTDSETLLKDLQLKNKVSYITKVLPFAEFKLNDEEFLNYFKTRKEAPFCETYIKPKLRLMMEKYGDFVKS